MASSIFAVIDTNVLVSALISTNPESPTIAVLENIYSGAITPVFNNEILDEYREVLSRDKFHLDPLDIEEALSLFTLYGLNLERTEVNDVIIPDPKDVVFYEVKMSKDDAYLVTGNIKHFPDKPFVVTPREMIEILETS
jgi:putative PIN family toxin of toxin-antitoxin system